MGRRVEAKFNKKQDDGTFKQIDIEGNFHHWGVNYEEFETGPGNYTVAIIELDNGKVVEAMPDTVRFLH